MDNILYIVIENIDYEKIMTNVKNKHLYDNNNDSI